MRISATPAISPPQPPADPAARVGGWKEPLPGPPSLPLPRTDDSGRPSPRSSTTRRRRRRGRGEETPEEEEGDLGCLEAPPLPDGPGETLMPDSPRFPTGRKARVEKSPRVVGEFLPRGSFRARPVRVGFSRLSRAGLTAQAGRRVGRSARLSRQSLSRLGGRFLARVPAAERSPPPCRGSRLGCRGRAGRCLGAAAQRGS